MVEEYTEENLQCPQCNQRTLEVYVKYRLLRNGRFDCDLVATCQNADCSFEGKGGCEKLVPPRIGLTQGMIDYCTRNPTWPNDWKVK